MSLTEGNLRAHIKNKYDVRVFLALKACCQTCIYFSFLKRLNQQAHFLYNLFLEETNEDVSRSHTEIKLKARRSKQTSNDTFTLLLLKRISVQLLVNVTISHFAKNFVNLLNG